MFHETAIQGRVFLLLTLSGIGAGAVYDLLSPLRRRLPRFAGAGADALWCLTTATLALGALALGGESRARPWAALGLLCGGGIYFLGIHVIIAWLAQFFRQLHEKKKIKKSPP